MTHLAILITIGLSSFAGTCTGTGSVPGNDILNLINQRRAENGCAGLNGDEQLRVAAERHAIDMRDNAAHLQPNTDGHTGTDGSRPEQRIAAAGFTPASRTGEIIYWADGPPGNTPEATVNWWMNSPDHRARIVDCAFTNAGVGLLFPGGVKWFAVVDLARH